MMRSGVFKSIRKEIKNNVCVWVGGWESRRERWGREGEDMVGKGETKKANRKDNISCQS